MTREKSLEVGGGGRGSRKTAYRAQTEVGIKVCTGVQAQKICCGGDPRWKGRKKKKKGHEEEY